MLTRLCTDRRNLGSRAFLTAALFAVFLIVVSVLPHHHTLNTSTAKAQSASALRMSSASCSLCDWLSAPHLPADTVVPVALTPVMEWRQPSLSALVGVLGFAVLSDSPQRGPPTALTANSASV